MSTAIWSYRMCSHIVYTSVLDLLRILDHGHLLPPSHVHFFLGSEKFENYWSFINWVFITSFVQIKLNGMNVVLMQSGFDWIISSVWIVFKNTIQLLYNTSTAIWPSPPARFCIIFCWSENLDFDHHETFLFFFFFFPWADFLLFLIQKYAFGTYKGFFWTKQP